MRILSRNSVFVYCLLFVAFAVFPQDVSFPAGTLCAATEKKTHEDRKRERRAREQNLRDFKKAQRGDDEEIYSGPRLKNNALDALRRLRRATKPKPYSHADQVAVDALFAPPATSGVGIKTFDRSAIKTLLEHSDQFLRFDSEVRAQLLWLVDNAERLVVDAPGFGSASAFENAFELQGGNVGPFFSFSFSMQLYDPEKHKDDGWSEVLNPIRQARSFRFCCVYTGPSPKALLPHGDNRRSPSVDSRTGKPYVGVSAKLLGALSEEDRGYVSFFAYSLNDAIHAAFGTPLPPTNREDWIAGKFIMRHFFPRRAIGFYDRARAGAKVGTGIGKRLGFEIDEECALEKEFPVQKKVFDDLVECSEKFATDRLAANADERSVSTGLVPFWGAEKSFSHEDLLYEYHLDYWLGSSSGKGKRAEEPTRIHDVASRVHYALRLLEELKAMREYLTQRDYASPAAAGTPKGKAMLALFENLKKNGNRAGEGPARAHETEIVSGDGNAVGSDFRQTCRRSMDVSYAARNDLRSV